MGVKGPRGDLFYVTDPGMWLSLLHLALARTGCFQEVMLKMLDGAGIISWGGYSGKLGAVLFTTHIGSILYF